MRHVTASRHATAGPDRARNGLNGPCPTMAGDAHLKLPSAAGFISERVKPNLVSGSVAPLQFGVSCDIVARLSLSSSSETRTAQT